MDTNQTERTGYSPRPQPKRELKTRPRPTEQERARRARQKRAAAQAQERRNARAKQRVKATKRPAPALVYTQPAVFNWHKFLMRLLVVAAIVMALVMALSIFFKVEKITVTGAKVYSEWTIREASGISEGDGLMTFSVPRACGRITAELPYVKNVRIGIKLPDTVNIIIEEEAVVYSIQSSDGLWWLMTSEGKVVETTDGGTAGSYTKILGVTLEAPVVGQLGVATEVVQESTAETDAEGNMVGTEPIVVTGAQRLEIAQEILRALEANDIVGEAASVNVAEIGDIRLWYGQQYLVKLGDSQNLPTKINQMCACIRSAQMKTGYGELDVSYTIWPDKIGYTPFEE